MADGKRASAREGPNSKRRPDLPFLTLVKERSLSLNEDSETLEEEFQRIIPSSPETGEETDSISSPRQGSFLFGRGAFRDLVSASTSPSLLVQNELHALLALLGWIQSRPSAVSR